MQEVGISLNRLFVFLLLIKVNNTAYSITYCKRLICFSMWISQIDISQMVRIRDTKRCWRCCPFEINILLFNYNVKGTWSILHLKGCLSTSLSQFEQPISVRRLNFTGFLMKRVGWFQRLYIFVCDRHIWWIRQNSDCIIPAFDKAGTMDKFSINKHVSK